MEWIMWIVTLASLIGTIANLHKLRWCFHVWLVCNVCWAIYDVYKEAYPQAVLMAIYAVLAVWGMFKWKRIKHDSSTAKKRKGQGKVRVPLSKKSSAEK